ncbi:hypothetical protein SASPL_132318 [Salvia splendens]|uniref:Peptidoglycan binding-like domain-containing protein n=1 Tax=Salvia splendens TaxID=180675 RepID=A0A8X8ZGZ8_SALSN|nr:hypothetical protein SASPL_132318 [Salvia splendens]
MKSQGLASLKKYFQLFGYINTSSDEFDEFLESTLKNFQLNFNLNQTGELDAPTLKQIFLPCYGNADIVNDTSTMHSGKSSNTYNVKQSTRPALLLLPQLPVLAAGEKPDHLRVRAVESTLRFGERHLQEGVRAISKVKIQNFKGTSSTQDVVIFSCSTSKPSQDVQIGDIDLKFTGEPALDSATTRCLNVKYTFTGGAQNPPLCERSSAPKPLPNYINTSYDEFDEFLESTLKNYQLNFNINQTGELDAPTLKQIFLPRYDNTDIVNDTSTKHSGKSSNTYNVKQSTRPALLLLPQLPVLAAGEEPDHLRVHAGESTLRFGERHLHEGVRAVVGCDVLTFVETTTFNCADLRIGFFSSDHGDE